MQLLRPGGTRKEREHRWYRLAFVAAVIVFILLAPEVNNGNYMDPTITDGQALVTSKTSFTMNRGMPDRGQLVILKKPFSREAGAKDNIITRVIGLPGDTVEITEGNRLLINGNAVVEPNIFYMTSRYEGYTEYPLTLQQGECFVLADSRRDGTDSRYFGPVSKSEIEGTVITIVRRNNL